MISQRVTLDCSSFGISNPSPGFIARVATAYKSGLFSGIGSGSYGDLAAMIAAILLDRESRSIALDADPSHGQLREPILKVTSLFHSMEAEYNVPKGWPKLFRLGIGQDSYGAPSVFSFFLPEHSPAGVISLGGLVAPEAQVLAGSTVTKLLDGLLTTVKFGVLDCFQGFGHDTFGECPTIEGAPTDSQEGALTYSVEGATSIDEVLDDLSLLLTSGRLSDKNKEIIKDTVEDMYLNGDSDKAIRIAQQLILMSPEFHVWGQTTRNTGTKRSVRGYDSTPKHGYKAVVYIFLDGGVDSFNLLVPKGNCAGGKNMYNEYVSARGPQALPESHLLDIDASGSGQVCDTFGVHKVRGFAWYLSITCATLTQFARSCFYSFISTFQFSNSSIITEKHFLLQMLVF